MTFQATSEHWRPDPEVPPPAGHNTASDPGPDHEWRLDISAFNIDQDAIIGKASLTKFEAAIREQGDRKVRLRAIDQAQWRWRQKLPGNQFKLYSAICDLAKMAMAGKEPRAALLSLARIGHIVGIGDPSDVSKLVAGLENAGAIAAIRWMVGKKKRGYFTPIVTANDRIGQTSRSIMDGSRAVEDDQRRRETERKRKLRERQSRDAEVGVETVPGKIAGTGDVPGKSPGTSQGNHLGQSQLSQGKSPDCPRENPHLVSSLLGSAAGLGSTKGVVASASTTPEDFAVEKEASATSGRVTFAEKAIVQAPPLTGDLLSPSDDDPAGSAHGNAIAVPFPTGRPLRTTRGEILRAAAEVGFPADRAMAEAASVLYGVASRDKPYRPTNMPAFLREKFGEALAGMIRVKATMDRASAEARSTLLTGPDDGLGPWRYRTNDKQTIWVKALDGHQSPATLNIALDKADVLHGERIARVVDMDAALSGAEKTTLDQLPVLILAAAIKRVHGYAGGSVPIAGGVIDRVAAQFPAVPRAFIVSHVGNCFAAPRSVGCDPLKFNGDEWVQALVEATVRAVPVALRATAEMIHANRRQFLEGGALTCDDIGRIEAALFYEAGNEHDLPAAYAKALAGLDLTTPFVDLSPVVETVFRSAQNALLARLQNRLAEKPWRLTTAGAIEKEDRIRSMIARVEAAQPPTLPISFEASIIPARR